MGYRITIGELEIEKCPDDGLDSDCIMFRAKGVHHAEAPAFGDPTDYTNSRWPSYTAWAEFARITNLYEVLFCDGTLLGGHPGVRLVTKDLVERVSGELAAMRIRFPELTPEYGTDEGAALCRLIWLDYWLRWSLENCDTPVIANS